MIESLAAEELVGRVFEGEGKVLDNMSEDIYDPEKGGTKEKVVLQRENANGTTTEIHTNRDINTGELDDVKISDPNKKSCENERGCN